MQSLTEIFSANGALAEHLPQFPYRAPQQAMAELVGEALAGNCHAVIEAGTGIGKTFAYLVPLLLAGRRAIVSTGTKTLQDQLCERDLPSLSRVLGRPVDIAMLKGRSNYLCWQRLEAAIDRGVRRRELADRLAALAVWGRTSESGDLSEVEDLSEDYRTLALATSTADNCLGSRCERFDDCFVARARRRAQSAQVVIVNHHLLLADLALRDNGFGELLPSADVVVVDEAHLLPDIAQQFFGTAVSSRELERIAVDIEDEATIRSESELAVSARQLASAAAALRPLAGAAAGRLPWAAGPGRLRDALGAIAEPVSSLSRHLNARLESGSDSAAFERCAERLESASERLAVVTQADVADGLRWFDVTERTVVSHLTPFDVASVLGKHIAEQGGAWIFASATLAVGDDFGHFTKRVGVDAPLSAVLPSPFDYDRNARLHIPDGLPDPGEPDHTDRFVDALVPLLRASGGGAFLLFTSFRALDAAERRLRDCELPGPLLVQGTQSRTALLDAFRQAGNGILLGSGSFWQGVDVRGEALRIVAIDKLPFAVPGDPVIQARIEAIRRDGGNAFADFQLPQAVLSLKQGVGRLIRDFDDRGLVVLGDPRLRTRAYGPVFLRSLPPMRNLDAGAALMSFAAGLNPALCARADITDADSAARLADGPGVADGRVAGDGGVYR